MNLQLEAHMNDEFTPTKVRVEQNQMKCKMHLNSETLLGQDKEKRNSNPIQALDIKT